MSTQNRRYDIDWVRVIAIGLLLIYHVAIGFQAWGIMVGFITGNKTWESLWIPMTMLNVWRIPLLFFVSGMGVYFAIQNRNWKQLLLERGKRIFVPFLFGVFFIAPIHTYLWQHYNNFPTTYSPNPGHLWFLGNIVIYILILCPVFYFLKVNENGKVVTVIRTIFSHPAGLLTVVAAFVAEVLIVKPYPYELYAMTAHGFFLGLLAFFFGFCFMLASQGFWGVILKWRWMFLVVGVTLFTLRFTFFRMNPPQYLIPIESIAWIISVLAFASRYLNRSGKALDYLSQAAYPIYILHMIFLSLGLIFIFPLDIPVQLQFVCVLLITVGGCLITYEFLVRRVNVLRVLFGLKWERNTKAAIHSSTNEVVSSES